MLALQPGIEIWHRQYHLSPEALCDRLRGFSPG